MLHTYLLHSTVIRQHPVARPIENVRSVRSVVPVFTCVSPSSSSSFPFLHSSLSLFISLSLIYLTTLYLSIYIFNIYICICNISFSLFLLLLSSLRSVQNAPHYILAHTHLAATCRGSGDPLKSHIRTYTSLQTRVQHTAATAGEL